MRKFFGLRRWLDPKTGEVLATSLLKPPVPAGGWKLMLLFMWDALFHYKQEPYPDKREDLIHKGD